MLLIEGSKLRANLSQITKRPRRVGTRFSFRKTTAHELLHARFDVKRQLIVDVPSRLIDQFIPTTDTVPAATAATRDTRDSRSI